MSNYFNEAGEPLMDGAAMRYEMYLDSLYEPDPDEFYSPRDDYAPCDNGEQCQRLDADMVDLATAECPWCGEQWEHDWSK